MLCREYHCLFVHIPKTAGQSIESFFLDRVGRTARTKHALLLQKNMHAALGPVRLSHLTASEYVACGHLSVEEFQSLYKFSFVRNPWDRLVSEYEARPYSRVWDFKSFVFKHFPHPGRSDKYRHVIPQSQFLLNEDNQLLVNYVGRFEKLQSDFNLISKNLGIPASSTTLPHKNKSRRRHYREYYDDESRTYVEELYRRDLELFHYTFAESDQNPPRFLNDNADRQRSQSGNLAMEG